MWRLGSSVDLKRAHNPKVAGSNPAPATMNDEGLADAAAANPFRLPRLHPGIGRAAGDAASRTAAQKPKRLGEGAHGAEHHSFTGVRMGAPLAFSSTTTNLAGSVLLALRPTT